jgi:hypothetical protein
MKNEEKELTLREHISMSENDRLEEELVRPRIEIWPDEWVEWVSSHEKGQSICLESEVSPFCPRGYH